MFSLDSGQEHLEREHVCLGCVALAYGTRQEVIEIYVLWRFEDGLSFSFIYCLAIFTLLQVIRYRCYSKIYHPFYFDF